MSTPRPVLYSIPYSPWSRKAKWAVDHAGVDHSLKTFIPLVNTPWIRLRAGKLRGRLTAPLWIEGRTVLMDSLAIARHVDGRGAGTRLFPAGAESAIEAWNESSERCLAAGRALTTAAVARDPVALGESVPPPLNRLGPLSAAVGRLGVRYLSAKYGFSIEQQTEALATLREGLLAVRSGLAGGRHLVGDGLTYADVAMAHVLHFVAPPRSLPVGAGSRPHWSRPELVEEFSDLLAWRDQVLAR